MTERRIIKGDDGEEWFACEVGDIRLDRQTRRLVKLRQAVHTAEPPETEVWDQEWVVEDLLKETIWTCDEHHLGCDLYSDMEVLAWVADQL